MPATFILLIVFISDSMLGTTPILLNGVVTASGYRWHGSPPAKKALPSVRDNVTLSWSNTSLPSTTTLNSLTVPMLPVGQLQFAVSGASAGSSSPFPDLIPSAWMSSVPSLHAFNPSFHVTHSVEVVHHSDYDTSSSASFCIPWTKTTKEEGAIIVLTAHNDHLCPLEALTFHFSINPDIPGTVPLFSFASPSGYSMPTKSFLAFCSSIWKTTSLPAVSSHSFWIGGMGELLTAGVLPKVVAHQGSWTSLTFLVYWRRVEQILPMNITSAYKKKWLQELVVEMEVALSRMMSPWTLTHMSYVSYVY